MNPGTEHPTFLSHDQDPTTIGSRYTYVAAPEFFTSQQPEQKHLLKSSSQNASVHHHQSDVESRQNDVGQYQQASPQIQRNARHNGYEIFPAPSLPESAALHKSQRLSLLEFNSAPSPINDTPYILYAIEQITRLEDDGLHYSQRHSYPTNKPPRPPRESFVKDEGVGVVQSIKKVRPPTIIAIPPSSSRNSIRDISQPSSVASSTRSEQYIPVSSPRDSPRHPRLTHKPKILRPLSLLLSLVLCLLMISALLFCAIYSLEFNGLANYSGGLYSGRYFIFRFLPQLLAAIFFLYIQAILTSLTRILPFIMMAGSEEKSRSSAIFTRLYPNLLHPRIDLLKNGQPLFGLCALMLWPVLFTIPFQSALFMVAPTPGEFRWAAVQGVVWTLIVIYILAFVGLALLSWLLFRKTTGLKWDPRSLADIISILARSNNLEDYQGTEIVPRKKLLHQALSNRSDRLGYWQVNSSKPELFYAMASEGSRNKRETGQAARLVSTNSLDPLTQRASDPQAFESKIRHQGTQSSLLAKVYSPAIRFRYMPVCIRPAGVVAFATILFASYLAMLVVSFLPTTALINGFLPRVSSTTSSGSFSAAAFLYAFLPSVIGMLLYISIDHVFCHLAIFTPWKELNNQSTNGCSARKSLLLDYAYTVSIPFLSFMPALRNQHHLVALLSIITPISLLLPILGGGFLFPLTAMPSNTVFIFPNLVAYYIIIVVLGIVVISIIVLATVLLPRSSNIAYRLPHDVSCLAEITTFLYASNLISDPTFLNVKSKAELQTRLLATTNRSSAQSTNRYTGSDRKTSRDKRKSQARSTQNPNSEQGEDAISRDLGGQGWTGQDWSGWDKEMGLAGTEMKASLPKPSTSPASFLAPFMTPFRRKRTSATPERNSRHTFRPSWGKRQGIHGQGGNVDDETVQDVVRNDNGGEKKYFLGIFRGSDGETHFGIEKVGRELGRDGFGRSKKGRGISRSHFSV